MKCQNNFSLLHYHSLLHWHFIVSSIESEYYLAVGFQFLFPFIERGELREVLGAASSSSSLLLADPLQQNFTNTAAATT